MTFNFDNIVIQTLGLQSGVHEESLHILENYIGRFKHPKCSVTIAMCGKYNSLHDAYKSILEAFIHAGISNDAKVNIKWVDTEKLESNSNDINKFFKGVDGILIPGGFGDRGIEGKILSAQYARENQIPFFGICLGMQCAVIEFSRNICQMKKANSTEFNRKTPYPVIDLMSSQKKVKGKGASMRLGKYSCSIVKRTNTFRAYNTSSIFERHRHRYELNNKYRRSLENKDLIISGTNKKLNLIEIIELKGHPWFIGVQFHPELKSRIMNTHPLFKDFISAAITYHHG